MSVSLSKCYFSCILAILHIKWYIKYFLKLFYALPAHQVSNTKKIDS